MFDLVLFLTLISFVIFLYKAPEPIPIPTAVSSSIYPASIFKVMLQFARGTRREGFGLTDPRNGRAHVLIFASSLRIDFAARATVLNSAALPLVWGSYG